MTRYMLDYRNIHTQTSIYKDIAIILIKKTILKFAEAILTFKFASAKEYCAVKSLSMQYTHTNEPGNNSLSAA